MCLRAAFIERVFYSIVFLVLVATSNKSYGRDMDIECFHFLMADSTRIDSLYRTAEAQMANGQLHNAQYLLEEILSLDSLQGRAHFELAKLYFEYQDFDRTLQALRMSTELDPNNQSYWMALLDFYRGVGVIEEMPEVFDQLIRISPENEAHYFDKVYLLQYQERYEEALALYDVIHEKFGVKEAATVGKSQVYLSMGNIETAISLLEALNAENPAETHSYLLLSEIFLKNREPKKAIKVLDEVATRFPEDPTIWVAKSAAYWADNKKQIAYDYLFRAFTHDQLDLDVKAGILYAAFDRKLDTFDRRKMAELTDLFVKLSPGDVKVTAVSGDIYAQLGNLEEARNAYSKALRIDRNVPLLWEQLLRVLLQLGLYEELIQQGLVATAIFPEDPFLTFMTGHGYFYSKQYEQAREYYEASLNYTEEDDKLLLVQAYSVLGDTYNALKMYDESSLAYQEALELDSNNAYVLNNYAYYLSVRKQNLEKAAAMSKKSNRLVPGMSSFEDTYAWILFHQGNYAEALVWIQKAVGNMEDDSDTLFEHYGDILYMNNEKSKAISQWKKAKHIASAQGKDISKLEQKINKGKYIE